MSDCGDSDGADQLRAKRDAAQSRGGTITFTCGPMVVLGGSVLPTITTNITIKGGSTITLRGNNASRVFYMVGRGTFTVSVNRSLYGFFDA